MSVHIEFCTDQVLLGLGTYPLYGIRGFPYLIQSFFNLLYMSFNVAALWKLACPEHQSWHFNKVLH